MGPIPAEPTTNQLIRMKAHTVIYGYQESKKSFTGKNAKRDADRFIQSLIQAGHKVNEIRVVVL